MVLFRLQIIPLIALAMAPYYCHFALADEALSDEQYQAAYGKAPAKVSNDKKSPMRFWDGSFDRAADATYQVETNNRALNSEGCNSLAIRKAAGEIITDPQEAATFSKCQEAANKVRKIVLEAKKIRKEQRIMAEVSRVSDVAAVAGIGTLAVTQMTMAKGNDASSFAQAASLQRMAGYANYTTGVADLGMGAYAYASQKSRLEKLQKMASQSEISGMVDEKLKADLQGSINATKSAATSHALYGAGKVAAGYLSMKMAESNDAAAASMQSLPELTPPIIPPMVARRVDVPASAPVPFQSNSVGIEDPAVTIGSVTATEDASGSTGSSALPSDGRALASLQNKENKSASTAPPGSSLAGGKQDKAEEILSSDMKESGMLNGGSNATQGSEVVIGQGGGNRWGGGGKPGAAHEDMPSIGFFGGNEKSAATGVDANELFSSATEDGAAGGPNRSGKSLFDIVKVKYTKAVSSGMVVGPTFVEVR